MNRHQRRAAAKSGQDASKPAQPSTEQQSGEKSGASQPQLSVAQTESKLTIIDLSDLDIGIEQGADSGKQGQSPTKNQPGILMRWFSRLLLSRWVLARVNSPEVERLLMMVALETNRKDVADELTRREALRGISATSRR